MNLIVLAAGMGSRFGGLKQIEPINKAGEFIIDYSVYDAKRAGVDRVVFIIKKENYDVFKNTIGKRLEKNIEVCFVFQDNNDVPEGIKIPYREKPLGTGHALYVARKYLDEASIIISADDFYGTDAFKAIADHLRNNTDYGVVGYHIINTMSDFDSVKRGIYFADKQGYVKNFIESKIENKDGKIIATSLNEGNSFEIAKDQTVSMSFYGVLPGMREYIEKDCKRFFESNDNLDTCEYFLPDILTNMINEGLIKLKSIPTKSKWMGITYREDLDNVKKNIENMTAEGIYPEKLW